MGSELGYVKTDADSGTEAMKRLIESIEDLNASVYDLSVNCVEKMCKAFENLSTVFGENANSQIQSLEILRQTADEAAQAASNLKSELKSSDNSFADDLSVGLEGMSKSFSDVRKEFAEISKSLDENDKRIFGSISTALQFASGLSSAAGHAANLASNWTNLSEGERTAGVLNTIAGAAIAAASAFALLKSAQGLNIFTFLATAAVIGLTIGAAVITAKENSKTIQSHANGGGFNTADLFYANENGNVELIASSNSGGGAVMNMEQLQNAVRAGMISAMESSGGLRDGVVVLDGAKVGKLVTRGVYNEGSRVGYWR